VKLHKNPSIRSRAVPCGQRDRQTDRHDEANSRFSQFCERACKRQIADALPVVKMCGVILIRYSINMLELHFDGQYVRLLLVVKFNSLAVAETIIMVIE
jgi:hypothetical protein